jgi:hypothetical protein
MKKWFGNNDSKTSASYFGIYDNYTKEQLFTFEQVKDYLIGLTKTRDTLNHYPIVELIYLDDESVNKVVAFRFTSDYGYDTFNNHLIKLSSSLGRGIWDHFRSDFTYNTFFSKQ